MKEQIIDEIILELGAMFVYDDMPAMEGIVNDMIHTALDIANISIDCCERPNAQRLIPYIKRGAKSAYLARGNEGMTSRSEGSLSTTYEDIVAKLRTDIVANGLRRIR